VQGLNSKPVISHYHKSDVLKMSWIWPGNL